MEIVVLTEYLSGGELFERVAAEEFSLTEDDGCTFVRQICRGLQYMHEKVIMSRDAVECCEIIIGWFSTSSTWT